MTNRIAFFVIALCAFFSLRVFAADPATEQAPKTMQARVLGCAACRGAHGEGTDNDYFPRLAGKPAGYLYNQLLAFRDGRRKYPPMNYLLAYLPDAYLQQISGYFAAERPPFPTQAPTTMYGRPRFAKRSFPDEQGNKIAAMYPDFFTKPMAHSVPDGIRCSAPQH